MNYFNLLLLIFFILPLVGLQHSLAEPYWLKDSLRYAHQTCEQARNNPKAQRDGHFETRSPEECQADIAAFMSYLPAHPLNVLYSIEPYRDDVAAERIKIAWGPAANLPEKKWLGEKLNFSVHLYTPEHLEIYSPMLIDILISNHKSKEPWAFIEGVFVPQEMRGSGYGTALVNWACYKIKQLKPDTKFIFLYSSLDAPQNVSVQAQDAVLASRIAPYIRAGFRPWRQPFLTNVATIIQKIRADQESVATSRFLLHENDPGLIMVKHD